MTTDVKTLVKWDDDRDVGQFSTRRWPWEVIFVEDMHAEGVQLTLLGPGESEFTELVMVGEYLTVAEAKAAAEIIVAKLLRAEDDESYAVTWMDGYGGVWQMALAVQIAVIDDVPELLAKATS